MSFSIGIVGLPNVGKSTLFAAVTKKQVDAANYPFCTIDPNVGVVEVPDDRLQQLSDLSKSEKIIPTTIEFVDIAGLVKNAHKGEGLGNQFLSHIKEVDAICQVVRVFEDDDIVHVEGKIDPFSDIDTIQTELALADLGTMTKRLDAVSRKAKSEKDEKLQFTVKTLTHIKETLENGTWVNKLELSDEEKEVLKELQLLTSKPMLYALNMSEGEPLSQEKLEEMKSKLKHVVPFSARMEQELAELSPEEAQTYRQEAGHAKSGLNQLIIESYKLLNLITFFTSGEKETRAWTVINGSTAPQAAGEIHTDFEKGFIRAETIGWKDLIEAGSESAAKEKGLMRLEGKDYTVADGDVMHFRFSV